MIEPVLPPACYTDQAWFDREQKKIFGELWLLVGLTQQLQDENSFITRNLGGVPVLVQRVDGELRAYRNACAHRGMPIQQADCGKRKLICPYHSWSYNGDGSLRGIPNDKLYKICSSQRSELRLQTFALEVVGNFVFVNLSAEPIPITEQYSSDMLRVLEGISAYFAPEVSYTTFNVDYNWKLNFENILDWNHVSFVHKDTFAPLFDYASDGSQHGASTTASPLFGEGRPLADVEFHSGEIPARPVKLADLSQLRRCSLRYAPHWYSGLFERAADPGAVLHCVLFPNLNFGSIHGEHYYLQQYVPVAPDKFEYHSWVFTTRFKDGTPPQPHLLWGIHHAEKRVVDEDVVLLNALQKSLKSGSPINVLGDHEAPLAAMGTWYMQHLNEEGTP
ncbi:aromatic ring-hydroxylating dioxygenase subunit alpha [Caballeronia sp. AZ10_KS36]|uniref:aromatic ring-hydroxylating oxygenase subunit alpha n=1 Tax=Caballeronia sp. AZ10_KS36 TaxID=2921757 RepID=UPI00202912A4|nr:aromatic ring-hydroxylating dioxygenase subunit alpha [Caballeronia sp. AZ10_KS36]